MISLMTTSNATILSAADAAHDEDFSAADAAFLAIRRAEISAYTAWQIAEANAKIAAAQAKAARAVWQRCITQYDTALDARAYGNAPWPPEVNPFAVAGEVVETKDEAIASRASEDASAYLRDRVLDNAY